MLAFNNQSNFHYHLGVNEIKRPTLSEANESRPVAIYEELFYSVLEKIRGTIAKETKDAIRLIDSTTISLNQHDFEWAKFHTHQNGMKLHFVYTPTTNIPIYFSMTPAKVNDCKAAKSILLTKGASYVFDRTYNHYEQYYKNLHLEGNTFAGRMKKNTAYEVIKNRKVGGNIIYDQEIRLNSKKGEETAIISPSGYSSILGVLHRIKGLSITVLSIWKD